LARASGAAALCGLSTARANGHWTRGCSQQAHHHVLWVLNNVNLVVAEIKKNRKTGKRKKIVQRIKIVKIVIFPVEYYVEYYVSNERNAQCQVRHCTL